MRDGDERTIECELVLVYQEPDHSVGINGGFGVHGIRLRGVTYELERNVAEYVTDPRQVVTYELGPDGAAALEAEAIDASESMDDEE